MTPQNTIKLNNNINIPILGLGTYLSGPGEETYNAVRIALDNGYRHIDTAAFYRNESDVGRAVRDSGIAREEIFVTTKVWNSDQGYDNTLSAFEASLNKLNLDYIDLYLIHWPQAGTRSDTYKALESIYESEMSKSIGISNYTIDHIEELISECQIMPQVNQVELSPFLSQNYLREYCNELNIVVESYSPLTRKKRLDEDSILKIANSYGKTPAQIMIRWCIDNNLVVLPKSANEQRIKENIDVFDFKISEEDMNVLNSLNEDYRIAWNPETVK